MCVSSMPQAQTRQAGTTMRERANVLLQDTCRKDKRGQVGGLDCEIKPPLYACLFKEQQTKKEFFTESWLGQMAKSLADGVCRDAVCSGY